MRLQGLARRGTKVVADNSPLILTAMGVAGTVATAVLTGKATAEAIEVCRLERIRLDEKRLSTYEGTRAHEEPYLQLTGKQTFELVWKLYIPAVGTGLMTCTCIVAANRIGTRRAAALAAAYLTSQEVFDEYRDKIIEKIGDKKEQEAHDEIIKERAERVSQHGTSAIVIAGATKQICFDAFSGRYGECDMETLRKAENDVNKQILHSDSATLSNFYSNIGWEATSSSGDFGWNTDKLMELAFTSILIEHGPYKGQTALAFDFAVVPIRDPWRFV